MLQRAQMAKWYCAADLYDKAPLMMDDHSQHE